MEKVKTFFVFGLLTWALVGCGYIQQKPVALEEIRDTPLHTPFWKSSEWIIARGSVHNHTTFSDGCRTPEDLIKQARNEGISVLSITDHREGRTCLGKDQKICVNMGGFDSKKVGSKRYFEYINRLASETENPILICGFEIGPYMWNEGYFPWLTLKATHWHFTVYGIETAELYAKIKTPWGIASKPQPDPGIRPYEDFVNSVIEQGGIVFQAHPESANYERYYNLVYLLSGVPTHLTEKLLNLTGVAIVPEGIKQVARPKGEWDRTLSQYLAGIREKPLWAIGDADYHCKDGGNLRNGTTLFYLRDFTKQEVLNAMREGRMVALMGEQFQEVYVEEFSVSGQKGQSKKIMLGESIKLDSVPLIRFKLNKELKLKEARLIRNGKIVFESESSTVEYLDEKAFQKKSPVYYRVELIGDDKEPDQSETRLFTNPIFVYFN